MVRAALTLAALAVGAVDALDNGLALTPPMGWRSWNCFHGEVNDSAIRATIDAITDRSRTVDGKPTSLADLGFDSVGIDDGWQACGTGYQGSFHDEAGTPLVNETKFPSLKDLVTYGHSKGVKMGWYTGNCICGEGGVENSNWTWANLTFVGDAKLSIEAGFDGMKIDNCAGGAGKGFELRMSTINASGKPVLVENSNQAHVSRPSNASSFISSWSTSCLLPILNNTGPPRPSDEIKLT